MIKQFKIVEPNYVLVETDDGSTWGQVVPNAYTQSVEDLNDFLVLIELRRGVPPLVPKLVPDPTPIPVRPDKTVVWDPTQKKWVPPAQVIPVQPQLDEPK